jgi:hypothetical protein
MANRPGLAGLSSDEMGVARAIFGDLTMWGMNGVAETRTSTAPRFG